VASVSIEEYWIMRRVSMRIGRKPESDDMVSKKIFDKFVVKSYKPTFNK
jgi:hypothetical protein